MRSRSVWFGSAAALAMALRAESAVSIATDFQVGPGGVGSNFTPTYIVSNTDLINGLTPSASSGDFAFEISGGLPVLNNGAYGTITEPGGAPDRTHGAFGVAGGGQGTGTTVTYSLNTAANPLGYRITSIASYGGWNDNGRDQQFYTVQYSTVASPGTFVDIATVNFNPTVDGGLQTANRAIITEDALPQLATGVAAVRFNFNAGTENGYSGYAELDVIGSPVPEPTALGFVLTARLVWTRRRRHAGR